MSTVRDLRRLCLLYSVTVPSPGHLCPVFRSEFLFQCLPWGPIQPRALFLYLPEGKRQNLLQASSPIREMGVMLAVRRIKQGSELTPGAEPATWSSTRCVGLPFPPCPRCYPCSPPWGPGKPPAFWEQEWRAAWLLQERGSEALRPGAGTGSAHEARTQALP